MSRQSSMQSDPPSSPQVATAGSPANHQQPASSNNVNKDGRPAAQNAMQPAPASSAGVVPTISTTSTASTRDKLPPLTQQISLDDTLLSHRPSASADVAAVNKKRAVSVSTGTHMQQESSTDEPLSGELVFFFFLKAQKGGSTKPRSRHRASFAVPLTIPFCPLHSCSRTIQCHLD